MSTGFDNGLSVTALHNHFFFDHPKCISCTSKVRHDRATRDRRAQSLRQDQEIRAANPQPKDTYGGNPLREELNLSRTAEQSLRNDRETNNGMVKFSIGHPGQCMASKSTTRWA